MLQSIFHNSKHSLLLITISCLCLLAGFSVTRRITATAAANHGQNSLLSVKQKTQKPSRSKSSSKSSSSSSSGGSTPKVRQPGERRFCLLDDPEPPTYNQPIVKYPKTLTPLPIRFQCAGASYDTLQVCPCAPIK